MKKINLLLLISLCSGAFAEQQKDTQPRQKITRRLLPLSEIEKAQLAQDAKEVQSIFADSKIKVLARSDVWKSCITNQACVSDFIAVVADTLQIPSSDVALEVGTLPALLWLNKHRKQNNDVQNSLDTQLSSELSRGSSSRSEKIKALLVAGADIKTYPGALHDAIRGSDLALVRLFYKKYLAAGLDIASCALHIYGTSPLLHARYSDHRMIEYLLKKGVKPVPGENIIFQSCNYKNLRTDEFGWPLATFKLVIESGLGTQQDIAQALEKVTEAKENKAYVASLGPDGATKLDTIIALLEKAQKDRE